MNITITGSLGNISRPLAEGLIAQGHTVTVISHSPGRAAAITQLGAIPAIGSLGDEEFLLSAFKSADAVYLMIPPGYSATDIRAYMCATGDRYAEVIACTGITHVVNLSSIGAHRPDGMGPAPANYHIEKTLNSLPGVNVLHLRPGMFYTNFFGAIPMVKYQHMLGNNFDATVKTALSHPKDIADVAIEALGTCAFTGKSYRYIVGDEKTGGEIAASLGEAIGEPALNWVPFTDEALLQGLLQTGMSREMATVYMVETGIALRDGSLLEHYYAHKQDAYGTITLAGFAKEFAQAYQQ